MSNDLLPAADTAENAARMVALETVFGDFVAVLAAAQRHYVKTVANFHAFHRVDAHQRMGDVGIRAVKDRLAKSGGDTTGNNGDFRADGVALFFSARISSSNASILSGRAEERILFNQRPVFDFQRNVAHLGQAAADFNTKFLGEIFLAIAPAATRMAVSRAEERPPPR